MFNVNQVVKELRRRLPQYTDLCSEDQGIITGFSKSGTQITLTIPAHNTNTDVSDYLTVSGIRYKFGISKIKKLPTSAFNGKNRFLITLSEYDNPFSDQMEKQSFEIKDVSTDTQYNGFAIVEQYLPGSNSLIMQTSNNITANEILTQGNILIEIYNSFNVNNAINGLQQITVVDEDHIRFVLNDTDSNKKSGESFVVSGYDFSLGKTSRPNVILFPSMEDYHDMKLTADNPNAYTVVLVDKGCSGSHQGITNASPDVIESNQGGLSDTKDCFFHLYLVSKRFDNINEKDYFKPYSYFHDDKYIILHAIENILRTSNFTIPFRDNDGYAKPAIYIRDDQYAVYASRVIWFEEWKVTYNIYPNELQREFIQTKIKSLDNKIVYNNEIENSINIDYGE